MADGKQKAEWGHTIALLIGFQKAMTGQGPKLLDLIPDRYRGEEMELNDEQDAEVADLAFAELESGLKSISQKQE